MRWLRGNNLPLPPGSRDINGRLEIPNIQMDHAGPYICEAVDYPSSTPGQQMVVYLTVEKCMYHVFFNIKEFILGQKQSYYLQSSFLCS